ncbi:MAG: pyridoxamine 5'-phosphate oxidase family protein [Spirochaetes bacterium]|nr:pyridoxamine 5'-phosphate oxidase family protein [Spirochaetota bacterium]
MRRKDKEIASHDEISEILLSNNMCRLAYSDRNVPYITVMSYGYSDNCLFFHCAKEGRKLDIIAENNNVCFEITDSIKQISAEKACDFSVSFRTLIGYGKIEQITGVMEKKQALDILMRHHSPEKNWEYSDKMVDAVNILVLKIDSITGKKNRISL